MIETPEFQSAKHQAEYYFDGGFFADFTKQSDGKSVVGEDAYKPTGSDRY